MQLTSLIVCLQMMEILLWAWFYRWKCFATWDPLSTFRQPAIRPSAEGTPVPPRIWQTVDPAESLVGVLMCGVSANLLFAICDPPRSARGTGEAGEIPADIALKTGNGSSVHKKVLHLSRLTIITFMYVIYFGSVAAEVNG
jgi:hypothetical protein